MNMRKREKKRVNKKTVKKEIFNRKILLLSLFLIVLIAVNFILISAQEEGESFFQRWMNSTFTNVDAKVILFIMVVIVIFVILSAMGLSTGLSLLISIPFGFVLVAYVTPSAIIGIFRSFETLPLAIGTLLPVTILFGLTYLSVSKGSRTMMGMQLIFWGVYFFYNAMKLIVAWAVWAEALPTNFAAITTYVNVPTGGSTEAFWFWLALIVVTVISGIMTFMNGKFLNMALRLTMGVDQAATKKNINTMKDAMKGLKELGKEFEGKP